MLRFPVRRRTQPFNSQITLVEYDPEWPVQYEREAERIRRVLCRRALQVEHMGSTSVPGLIAKPIIDILLAVTDSSDEPSLPSSSRSCRLQTDNPGVPTVTSIAPSMVPISTSTFTSLQQDQRRSIGFSCCEIGCKRILAIQSLHKEPEGQLHSLQLRRPRSRNFHQELQRQPFISNPRKRERDVQLARFCKNRHSSTR